MTPVMYSDINGEFPILTILFVTAIVVYTATMIEDLHDIAIGEVYFEPSSDGGGKIVNSAKIINPSVTYGYSLYLRYASDHKDNFDGSSAGIAAEWNAHNAAYYWYTYLNKDITQADRAYDADVGRTLFSEDDMEVRVATAIQMNPILLIYDYVQYIRFRGDDHE